MSVLALPGTRTQLGSVLLEVGYNTNVQYDTINNKLYTNVFGRDCGPAIATNATHSLNPAFANYFYVCVSKVESVILNVLSLNHEATSRIAGIMARLRIRFGKYSL